MSAHNTLEHAFDEIKHYLLQHMHQKNGQYQLSLLNAQRNSVFTYSVTSHNFTIHAKPDVTNPCSRPDKNTIHNDPVYNDYLNDDIQSESTSDDTNRLYPIPQKNYNASSEDDANSVTNMQHLPRNEYDMISTGATTETYATDNSSTNLGWSNSQPSINDEDDLSSSALPTMTGLKSLHKVDNDVDSLSTISDLNTDTGISTNVYNKNEEALLQSSVHFDSVNEEKQIMNDCAQSNKPKHVIVMEDSPNESDNLNQQIEPVVMESGPDAKAAPTNVEKEPRRKRQPYLLDKFTSNKRSKRKTKQRNISTTENETDDQDEANSIDGDEQVADNVLMEVILSATKQGYVKWTAAKEEKHNLEELSFRTFDKTVYELAIETNQQCDITKAIKNQTEIASSLENSITKRNTQNMLTRYLKSIIAARLKQLCKHGTFRDKASKILHVQSRTEIAAYVNMNRCIKSLYPGLVENMDELAKQPFFFCEMLWKDWQYFLTEKRMGIIEQAFNLFTLWKNDYIINFVDHVNNISFRALVLPTVQNGFCGYDSLVQVSNFQGTYQQLKQQIVSTEEGFKNERKSSNQSAFVMQFKEVHGKKNSQGYSAMIDKIKLDGEYMTDGEAIIAGLYHLNAKIVVVSSDNDDEFVVSHLSDTYADCLQQTTQWNEAANTTYYILHTNADYPAKQANSHHNKNHWMGLKILSCHKL